jgi:ATP-binding cassette, subfamily B, bacterial PglK
MLNQIRKCLRLIERATVWQGAMVSILVVLTALLEALGIGMIFAFVQVLIEPARIKELVWLKDIVGPIVASNEKSLLTLLVFGLLGVYIAKNATLLGFYYVQARFVAMNEYLLSARLVNSYLRGAYKLHLTRNSAEFIRNITGAITTVFSNVIVGFINLASEIAVIIALSAVMLLVEPMLSLGATLVSGLTVFVFFAVSKNRFVAWGEREQTLAKTILQALQQGFYSIKEVKILGRQQFILRSFKVPRLELAHVRIKLGTMSYAPRLWVESVIVSAVLLVVVFALSEGANSARILSALTLFAAAAFRMIPSMNKILISLSTIKNGAHGLELVYADFQTFLNNQEEESDKNGTALTFSRTLSIENLSFAYPNGDGLTINNFDLTLRRGESLGLVGPSGSGKSTLVDIILGLYEPTKGQITLDGIGISESLASWRQQIGYVPQSIYIIDDTLRRNVAFAMDDDDIDDRKIEKAIRLAQLEELVRDLPEGLDTRLGERGVRLSGGQRQRVGIARALYRDPEVLILDEATSSLDTETEHEINNAIERLTGEKTLIIIAHRLSTVRKCTRLAYIRDGHLIDTGSFDELKNRNADFNNLIELSQL